MNVSVGIQVRIPALTSAAVFAAIIAGLSSVPRPAVACGTENYLGHVCFVPYTKGCPTSYTEADGRILQSQDNQALYSLIGNTYGGNGPSQFALPDLRGRTPVGSSLGASSNYPLGTKLGQESVTLTMQNIPAHTHALYELDASAPIRGSSGWWGGMFGGRTDNPEGNTISSGKVGPEPFQSQSTDDLKKQGHLGAMAPVPVTVQSGSINIQSNSAAQTPTPAALIPPQTALVACIATTGLFPPRN
jgi:microcystin-dependent protein